MSGRDSRSSRKTQTKNQICCGIRGYHRHCVVCRGRLRPDQRVFCGDPCRADDKRQRRNARSIRCLIQPEDGSGAKVRRWIPLHLLGRKYTRVSTASRAVGATQRRGS